MDVTKTTPQLRFPEFTDKWQVKKLGDIAEFSKGSSISKNDIHEDGKIEAIRYGELYTTYSEVIDEVQSRTNLSPNGLKFSKANDVIVPASGETAIDIATASCVLRDNIALSGDLNIIRTHNDGVFMAYYLNNKKKNDIARLAQGVSVIHLYSSNLKDLEVNLPSKPEQEKIAGFLTAVDERIAVGEKKLELLETYKRGVMQKIFSQQIRFKDESGKQYPDWEEKKLGSVLRSGSKTPVDDTSKYQKITISLNKGGVRKASLSRKMTDTRPFYVREANEIIIGKQNYFNGSIAVMPQALAGSICSNAIMSFTVEDNCVTKFLYELISDTDFLKKRSALANGTGQKELSEKEFLNFDLRLPVVEEQQKIADFLTALDDKITAEKSKLTASKQFKKALLQRMFA